MEEEKRLRIELFALLGANLTSELVFDILMPVRAGSFVALPLYSLPVSLLFDCALLLLV